MAIINILDNNTIDKIAAGEVVERPVSIVKELVENSIDSGATIITVEIRNGGLSTIRVTDNGSGIEKDQIRKAFMAHATSKIKDANDLNALYTLGFRGEALSSISAVSRVEVTSKVADQLTGIHYCIEGGKEIKCEDVGAPLGTTVIVRDIFYNTLPRLKFLKSEKTEGTYISDMMEHLALSKPDISFQFINNGQTKFSTSGRGDLKEVIYRLYGRETSSSLKYIDKYDSMLGIHVNGYLGLPRINRANRSFEIFYINHRFIKSPMLSKAVEEGYIEYLMQHKFPFCILNFDFSPESVDVNVHPTKQEVRITNEKLVYSSIVTLISQTLAEHEMIDSIVVEEKNLEEKRIDEKKERLPEHFEINRIENTSKSSVSYAEEQTIEVKQTLTDEVFFDDLNESDELPVESDIKDAETKETQPITSQTELIQEDKSEQIKEYEQISYFDDDKLLSTEARRNYRIIGQVFKTYWLIEYKDSFLIMDQHAAHEKVYFERLMKYLNEKQEVPSQNIMPPSVITLGNREKELLFDNLERFNELGFVLEEFGDREVLIRAIPLDLYGSLPEDLIYEIIADLSDLKKNETPESVRNRIATMACKAAIKGNNLISETEVEALLDEMLTLDNPYNCPHGRPTVVAMTKAELEKRFHRIV